MSHSVKITVIADQEIQLCDEVINIHDLESITLDGQGMVVGYHLSAQEPAAASDGESVAVPGKGVFYIDCQDSTNIILKRRA